MTHIILHVGMHKTGTTTIQNTLFENRDELEKAGIYYPAGWEVFGGNKRAQSATAHFRFAAALAEESSDKAQQLSDFRDLISRKLDDGKAVIISAESLYRHLVPNQSDEGTSEERKYKARERFVIRLANYLSGLPVEAVMYIRRPDSFAESMYGEVILNSENKQNFSSFIKTDLFRFDLQNQISLLEKHFTTTVLVFETEAKKGLTRSLFDATGLIGPPAEAPALRTSVSKKAIQWTLFRKKNDNITSLDRQRSWLFALQPSSSALFACDPAASYFDTKKSRNDFAAEWSANIAYSFPEAPEEFKALPPLDDREANMITAAYMRWLRTNSEWVLNREKQSIAPFVNPVQ